MLIQPDTDIRLIKNCPLDNTYKHTIYFKNHNEQATYFKTKLEGIAFSKQSYQRYDSGVLHIQAQADTIYGCNYLMFKNTAFGNKWFYAFINSIEYVNNVSSKVYYEIDVLQTWLGGTKDENNDYTIFPCYIERQHTETDNVGDNIIPEDFNIGDYVYSEAFTPVNTINMVLVVQYTGALPESTIEFIKTLSGDVNNYVKIISEMSFCGVYHDSNFMFIPLYAVDMHLINDLISSMNIMTFGGLINVFMIPQEIMTNYINTADTNYPDGGGYFEIRSPVTLDGYIPRNRKMYTYPYTCVCLSNNLDTEKDYAFERFEIDPISEGAIERTACFDYVCPLESSARVMAYPKYYNGITSNTKAGIHSTTLPQCGFAGDKFANWFANNSLAIMASCLSNPMSSPIRFEDVPPKYTNTTSTEISTTDNYGAYSGKKSGRFTVVIDSDEISRRLLNIGAVAQHTGVSSNSQSPAIYGTGAGLITAYTKTIKREIAECIDSYFTMFGYAVKKIQQPNLNAREVFTYIKTVGFSAHGNVPASAMRKIQDIHDRGITYWNKDKVVGDYSQYNRTLSNE